MSLEFEKEQEQVKSTTYGSRLEQEDPKEPEVPEVDPKQDESEDGQLNLFGEVEKPKVKPKEVKKAKPKAKEEQKVDQEYMIYYAGHRVPVPQNNMTLESVRQFLEMDFPELSKARTEMTIDTKEKQIVPVVKGAKKG